MATAPQNQLINVKTWQENDLAWLLLQFVGVNIANKKFKDFDKKTANLGNAISFEIAPQAEVTAGLVVNAFQVAQQRLQDLICTQSANSNVALDTIDFTFNAKNYMDKFGRSRINVLGAYLEQDIFKSFNGTQRVNTPNKPNTGQLVDTRSGAYRFFGDGRTPINSQLQLVTALTNFQDYGFANVDNCAILPMTKTPTIIDTMTTKFTPRRNDDIVYNWDLGSFAGFDWYTSNQLPKQFVGNVGKTNTTLTLVSVNDSSGDYVTRLTFSGATANDSKAIKIGDLFQFNDDVSNQPDMRYLHFNGVGVSDQPVQCRVTGGLNVDANGNIPADSSGNVAIDIYPALKWTPGLGQTLQNLNNALNAGMQVSFVGDHIVGMIMSGSPFYLGMPELPDQQPYPTVTTQDKESGVAIRHYWGATLGTDVRAYIWDMIWASTFVGEQGMIVCFPL